MKGTAGLVGDALTFKWAQASMAQVAVNTVVVVEVILNAIYEYCEPITCTCDPFRLLVGSSLENALEKDLLLVTTSRDETLIVTDLKL